VYIRHGAVDARSGASATREGPTHYEQRILARLIAGLPDEQMAKQLKHSHELSNVDYGS
jgi:hypothetical protein